MHHIQCNHNFLSSLLSPPFSLSVGIRTSFDRLSIHLERRNKFQKLSFDFQSRMIREQPQRLHSSFCFVPTNGLELCYHTLDSTFSFLMIDIFNSCASHLSNRNSDHFYRGLSGWSERESSVTDKWCHLSFVYACTCKNISDRQYLLHSYSCHQTIQALDRIRQGLGQDIMRINKKVKTLVKHCAKMTLMRDSRNHSRSVDIT